MKYPSFITKVILGLLVGISCNAWLANWNDSIQNLAGQISKEVEGKKFLPLTSFMPLFDVSKIPPAIKTELDKLQIADVVVTATATKIQLSGITRFNNLIATVDFSFEQGTPTYKTHLSITFPNGAKASDISLRLSKLDFLQFSTLGLFLSNHDYTDPFSKASIASGLTFVGGLNFNSLVDQVSDKIDAKIAKDEFKKNLKSFFALDNLAVYGSCYISPDFTNMVFNLEMPIEFGMDFKALKTKNGKPVFNDPLVTKVTFSSIKTQVSLQKFQPEVTLSAGIKVYPKTQLTPLEFRVGGTVSQSGISIHGLMNGAFDPAFGLTWLAIGSPKFPMGIELYFDYVYASASMALCLVPLPSGITLSGGLGLGNVPNRVTGSAAIKLLLASTGLPEFIFSGAIDQINLSYLIEVLAGIGGKKLEAGKAIPTIRFSDMELIIAPFGGDILGVSYKAGMEAKAAVQFGSFKASGLVGLGLPPDELRLVVEADMDPFEVKTKSGTVIFGICGYDIVKKSDKAKFSIDFLLPEISKIIATGGIDTFPLKINIGGGVIVPPLRTSGAMEFHFTGDTIGGKGMLCFLNNKFCGDTAINFPMTEPQNFSFSSNVNNDGFGRYFVENLKNAFTTMKDDASNDVSKLEQKLKEINLVAQLEAKTEAELKKTESHITQINKELTILNPPAARKLSDHGENNIHISNHTDKTIYVGLYKYDKKTKVGTLFGNILALAPITKDQLERPSLSIGDRLNIDRDIVISTDKSKLTPKLPDAQYNILTWQNVGSLQGSEFHLLGNDVLNEAEWLVKKGPEIAKLETEKGLLIAYKETLLKHGADIAGDIIETAQEIAVKSELAVKKAVVAAADVMLPILDKAISTITFRRAALSTAGKDLLAGKLPMVSLNFEINLPGNKKLVMDMQNLQFDFANPTTFFTSVARSITLKMSVK